LFGILLVLREDTVEKSDEIIVAKGIGFSWEALNSIVAKVLSICINAPIFENTLR
jgi:hypothetical protein